MVVTRSRTSRARHGKHKHTTASDLPTSQKPRTTPTSRLATARRSSTKLQSAQKKQPARRARSQSTVKRNTRRATLPNSEKSLRLLQGRRQTIADLKVTLVGLQEIMATFGGEGVYDASIPNSEHPESILVAPNWAQRISETLDWHMSLNLCHFYVNILLKRLLYQRKLMAKEKHNRLHEAQASLIFGRIEFFYSIQHAISGFLCWGDESSDRPESKPAITALGVCRKLATGVPFDQVVLASALNRLHNPLWAMQLGSSRQPPDFLESTEESAAGEDVVDIKIRRIIYGTYFDRSTEDSPDGVCVACYKQRSRGLNEKCISCQSESTGQHFGSGEKTAPKTRNGMQNQSLAVAQITNRPGGEGRKRTLTQVEGKLVSALRDSGFNVPALLGPYDEGRTESSAPRSCKRRATEMENLLTSQTAEVPESARLSETAVKKRRTARKPGGENRPGNSSTSRHDSTRGAAISKPNTKGPKAATTHQVELTIGSFLGFPASIGPTSTKGAVATDTNLAEINSQIDLAVKKRATSRYRSQTRNNAAITSSLQAAMPEHSNSRALHVSNTTSTGPSHKSQASTSQKRRVKNAERGQARGRMPQLVNDLQEEDTIDFADGIEFGDGFEFSSASASGQKKGKKKGTGQSKKITNKAAVQQAWEKKGWNSTKDTEEEEREWQEQLDIIRESYTANNQEIPSHLLGK